MTGWKITGILATFVIILLIPIYIFKMTNLKVNKDTERARIQVEFVGSEKCRDCHRQEFDKWNGSHHRMAMAFASPDTVLGDFDNAEFDYFGRTSRFYKKGGHFFVSTPGPDGRMGDFEITHTFGWYPLQQYLVPFPGGRLQCLPIAWDVERKQWYHLYPEKPIDPSDWLYWTNNAQNWNGMCAECHSTRLVKGYDMHTDTYQTTWAEISVGCEACHGPGAGHVAWANMPDMARPETENFKLVVKTGELTSRRQIELCAPCHARRTSLADNPHEISNLMDYAIPQLLTEGFYFADGQILEEVYVYGSFTQSKMYARDVRCSDCHDVHSTKRIKEGNELCLQCHQKAIYDTKQHHFHKKKGEAGEPIVSTSGEILYEVGEGAQCEQCHMPGRIYMGIDYRPDHSFRIPRPDMSQASGIPNACNRCHFEKTNEWSLEYIQKWYGDRKRFHYGTLLAAGRRQQPEALTQLVGLAGDRLYPTIVRATALELLSSYDDKSIMSEFIAGLSDEEPLIRQTAIRCFPDATPILRLLHLSPLLYDPIKAVRIEAAQRLSAIPEDMMPDDIEKKFGEVLSEYKAAMAHTGDFATSRHNLGIMYANLGNIDSAITQYKKAIDIDDAFYPAKVNLAMLYNRKGLNREAEKLLTDVVTAHPRMYEIKYSLGLLLVEEKRLHEAERYLKEAAVGLPQRGRIYYNLGLLQQQINLDQAALASLKHAVRIDPDNLDFMYALADFYLKRRQWEPAKTIAEQMIEKHPAERIGHDILSYIKKNISTME